jgi:riboflavin synthase
MFTGIIEATGTVEERLHEGAACRLTVGTSLDVASLPLGASIAVDGVCLTVVDRRTGQFSADLGPETLARTTLGDLRPGDRVHLERPLKVGDPLGGHLVAGHVDGVGEVLSRRDLGISREVELAAPAALASALVSKGSVTVDGISLTVNAVEGTRFSVTLIPHTLAVTLLGEKPVGARVNLEMDLVAKHIERLVTAHLQAHGATADATADGITLAKLRKHGFAGE